MDFLTQMKAMAKNEKKTIVLPESLDPRTIEATYEILREGLADVILIGDRDKIKKKAGAFNPANAIFIDPNNYDRMDELAEILAEERKKKGMTFEEAKSLLTNDPLYLGVMLVKAGIADGMVAGAANKTSDVLRPALQIIKVAETTKIVSTFFIMVTPNKAYGEDGVFAFSDCGLNQNPNAEELAYIAIDTAKTFETLIGAEPRVAMLSHSTKGSASHPDVDKVVDATRIANELAPEIKIDGDLQTDAALSPVVASQKAPGSKVAGIANVLVFPDLDAGNIGYKLVHRLAGADAYGPITQGLKKPVNDLSRGCSAEDIVGVVAITAVQAQLG